MLALQALAVSAARSDIHSVFAGLVLMTYHGVVLLLSGYQADEAHIIKQYKAIVSRVDGRYPDGSLWILNKAKIQRMTYDTEGAIETLRDGLKPERKKSFPQADTLLTFELAWTLLSHRRYEETAKQFLDITQLNSWFPILLFLAYLRTNLSITQESCDILLHCSWLLLLVERSQYSSKPFGQNSRSARQTEAFR
jgi:hypothetical protein